MTITLDKNDYIVELEKALENFFEAKTIGNKEQIKYFQGYSKGIVSMLRKLEILSENELKEMVKNAELDSPAIFRTSNG